MSGRDHIYGPIGHCIYCGPSKTKDLSDEHIIPEGLGGKAKIQKASCAECRDITSRTELFVLRNTYRFARKAAGIKSRKRKVIPSPAINSPIFSEMPVSILVTRYGQPGILSGANPDTYMPNVDVLIVPTGHGDPSVVHTTVGTHNHRTFTSFLAKVSHCVAIANYGYGAFKPYLLDTIMGRKATADFYHIGGYGPLWDPQLPASSDSLGCVSIDTASISGKTLIRVALQFFSYLNTPVYQVFAGELLDGS